MKLNPEKETEREECKCNECLGLHIRSKRTRDRHKTLYGTRHVDSGDKRKKPFVARLGRMQTENCDLEEQTDPVDNPPVEEDKEDVENTLEAVVGDVLSSDNVPPDSVATDPDNDAGDSDEDDDEIQAQPLSIPLFEGSGMTLLEGIESLLEIMTNHPSVPGAAMKSVFETVRAMLPQPNELCTFSKAKTLLAGKRVHAVTYDACVHDCIVYRDNDTSKFSELVACPVCREPRRKQDKPQKKVWHIPITQQLIDMYSQSRFAAILPFSKCVFLHI